MKNKTPLRRGFALLLMLSLLLSCTLSVLAEKKMSGTVRVLLTKLNLGDRADIALDGSYTLNDIAFQRGSRLTAAVIGKEIYVYYEGMSLNAGKTLTLIRHETDDGTENGVRINGNYALHPGDLYLTVQNGKLRAVLHAPVEEYILGVVPYEMSDSYPLEALKAQAVAARTYALRKAGASGDYDLVDNTNDQAYYGVKKEHKNAARAVRETAGVCGFWKGSLAQCYYSASNGGQTELPVHVWGKAESGCYAAVEDPYDLENPESTVKKYAFPKQLSSNADLGPLQNTILGILSEQLESQGWDGDAAHIRVAAIEGAETALPLYRDGGGVMTLLRLTLSVEGRRLVNDADEQEISIFDDPAVTPAPAARREEWGPMQKLPSPITVALDLFPTVESALNLSINSAGNEVITVRETDTSFVVESRRFGHGVGMSQRGAQRMAGKYGFTYEQILRFYYPGMTLETVSYTASAAPKLQHLFLATPAPAVTPTPRPTLMPVSVTPAPGEYKVKVSNIGVNSYLNLRAEPNTQAGVLRQLYFGQELIVTKDLGEWLLVRTDDLQGYVMTQFVEKAN